MPLRPYAEAVAHRYRVDWAREEIPTPAFTGRRVAADVSLGSVSQLLNQAKAAALEVANTTTSDTARQAAAEGQTAQAIAACHSD